LAGLPELVPHLVGGHKEGGGDAHLEQEDDLWAHAQYRHETGGHPPVEQPRLGSYCAAAIKIWREKSQA
jgi:hypothetical protein